MIGGITMKYTTKFPETDKELSIELSESGWKKIKEPKNLRVAIIYSVPFIILNSILFWVTMKIINNSFIENFFRKLSSEGRFNITINLLVIPAIIIIIYIHELCHLILVPNFIKSEKTYLGLSLLGGFISTTEKIRRERYVLISLTPFFILSILMPILLNSMGLFNKAMLFLCLLNAMGSSVDFLNALILSIQVPRNSYIISNGFETYFKDESE